MFKKKIYKVFISSSFNEKFELGFEKEREWLRKKIAQNPNFKDISLDVPTAYSGNTTDESLKRVREADIVILFIGSRYGTIRDEENGLSLTHMEYREAKKYKKAILPYIFPINKKAKDYHKVEQFIKEVIKDNKSGAVYIRDLLKDGDYDDVLSLKQGQDTKVDESRIKVFCDTFSLILLNQLMLQKDRLDKKKIYIQVLLLLLLVTVLIASYFFIARYKEGVDKGIQTVLEKNDRYLKLQKQERILKYKINHSQNSLEIIELNKALEDVQKKLKLIEQQLKYYNENNKPIEKKIYNTKGPKAAYEYLKTEEALAKEEYEENKLIKLYLHKARLAYEAGKIEDSFSYYNKILTLSPTYEYYEEYRDKLFFQNRNDKQLIKLQKKLLLKNITLTQQANIMSHICVDNNNSYCEKAVKAYESIDNKNDYQYALYAISLIYYASLNKRKYDNNKKAELYFNIANKVIKKIKDKNQKKVAKTLWYFNKAICEKLSFNYKKALKYIEKSLKYNINNIDNKIMQNTINSINNELLERENEGKKLEKKLLSQIKSVKKLVKKYPILYDSYLDYYFQLISFYVSRDSDKAEDKIVEALYIYKNLVKKGKYINRYLQFLMAYQSYCLEMNRKSLSKEIQRIIEKTYRPFKIKDNNISIENNKTKNNHKFYVIDMNSYKISNPPNIIKKHEQERNKTIEEDNNISKKGKEGIFLHAINYINISYSYSSDFDDANANKYALKALKEINKLVKDDFNLHSIFLIDIYDQILTTETNLEEFEIYKNKLEKIYAKLLQKDRDKFYSKYLISIGNIGIKYLRMNDKNILNDNGQKAEKYLLKSIKGLENITSDYMARYIPSLIKMYRALIIIEREYSNREKVAQYRKKMHQLREKLSKIHNKIEFESMKIIKDIGIPKFDTIDISKRIYFKEFRTQGSMFSEYTNYNKYLTNLKP